MHVFALIYNFFIICVCLRIAVHIFIFVFVFGIFISTWIYLFLIRPSYPFDKMPFHLKGPFPNVLMVSTSHDIKINPLSVLLNHIHLRRSSNAFMHDVLRFQLREVIRKKSCFLLDIVQKWPWPPPPPRFGHLWGNFRLNRLRKKHTTTNYPKTT